MDLGFCQYAIHAEVLLNMRGMGAQFVRWRCSISAIVPLSGDGICSWECGTCSYTITVKCGIIRKREPEGMIEMTVAELQSAIPELNPYQVEQITTQIVKYLNLNEELKNTRPTVCLCCGRSDVPFIKKGMHAGKQR